jgi:serine phosphatase RsbU (regulator of sigma subunit)
MYNFNSSSYQSVQISGNYVQINEISQKNLWSIILSGIGLGIAGFASIYSHKQDVSAAYQDF